MARRICLLFVCALAWLNSTSAAEGDPESSSIQAPIYFFIEPVNVSPAMLPDPSQPAKGITGFPMKIHGATGSSLFGKTLRVTITPPKYYVLDASPEAESRCPQDADARVVSSAPARRLPPTILNIKVSGTGRFETTYTPQVDGEYEVVIEGGGQRGEKSFETETPDFEDECAEIPEQELDREATQLRQTVCQAVDVIEARAKTIPESPARAELIKQIAEFRRALHEAPDCDDPPPWINGVIHIKKLHQIEPRTRRATAGLTKRFNTWLDTARRANAEAPRALAQLSAGNVACDQLDVIVNGLKFCDFYLGLLVEPGKWLLDWAKENAPTKLVGMVPAVKRSPVVKEAIESAWKGATTFYEPKRAGGRVSIVGVAGHERELGKQKMAFNLSIFAANRIFEQFCQQFQGPVSGSMSVEIYENGQAWWTYTVTIAGELVLRYPRNARGDAIALTGEFLGNATSFKSWDNAVPVLFPKLAMGTVFRTLRIEPVAMNDFGPLLKNPLAGSDLPDPNPITTTIEQGGLITRYVLTPAFYRVPVRGDLRGDTLRIELQPAALDFDDRRVKVVQVLLPVLSLWPTVNDYALPYKGAHFILTRAMNDGPAEFKVKRTGDTMSIERSFTRERKTAENKGNYVLKVKACNPACN
nr:hypothetical protein [uncultured Steroidobacter sp.]